MTPKEQKAAAARPTIKNAEKQPQPVVQQEVIQQPVQVEKYDKVLLKHYAITRSNYMSDMLSVE